MNTWTVKILSVFALLTMLPSAVFASPKIPLSQAANEADSRSIDDFELSTRTANCLKVKNLLTLGSVREYMAQNGEAGFLKILNFGPTSLPEVLQLAPAPLVEILPFSLGTRNSLRIANIITFDQVRAKYLADGLQSFLRMRNFGKTALLEVAQALEIPTGIDKLSTADGYALPDRTALEDFNLSTPMLLSTLRSRGIKNLGDLRAKYAADSGSEKFDWISRYREHAMAEIEVLLGASCAAKL